MAPTFDDSHRQKRRISVLAVLSLACALLGILVPVAATIAPGLPSVESLLLPVLIPVHRFLKLTFLFGSISLIASIPALRAITRSNGRLLGKSCSYGAILISIVAIGAAVYLLVPKRERYPTCGTFINGLGKVLAIYARDYDGRYPTADKWCDLLVSLDYVLPKYFLCNMSGAVIGESSYAMNINIVGKKASEIPPDVVLLFETNFGKDPAGRQELLRNRLWYKTIRDYAGRPHRRYWGRQKLYKLRWNQIGGPDMLTVEHHGGEGCNVLFADGRVEFVKTKNLGNLKWK